MSENSKTVSGNPEEKKQKVKTTQILKYAAGIAALVILIVTGAGLFRVPVPLAETKFVPGVLVDHNAPRMTLKSEQVAPRVDIVGTVASEIKVNISPRIPGTVSEIAVTAGSEVKKGQELVKLDDRELQEQVTATEAQFRQAEAEFKRTKQLFDNKATTQQALDAAEAMFNSAKAQLERSRVMVTYASLTSPMDGVVTDRRVEPGDLANPGQPLLTIYDPARLQLEAPVPARLLKKLPLGQKVEISLDLVAEPLKGEVTRIVSEIDPYSRTQLVKVTIQNPPAQLLPGTFGRLWVPDDAREAVLAPASAITRIGQLEYATVVQDDRAIRRAVRTAPAGEGMVEVLAGLSAGDTVLTDPEKKE